MSLKGLHSILPDEINGISTNGGLVTDGVDNPDESKKEKTLLIDIDHTLFDGATPRPYLKEFLLRMNEKYNLHFYTAADFKRVSDVCRIMFHQLGMDADFVRELQRYSLHRGNCQMIKHYLKDGEIEIKCMHKASEVLRVPIENLLLLDDAPTWGHPQSNQIIQAEGFMAWDEKEDDYLNRVEITDDMFKGTPDIVNKDGMADLKTSQNSDLRTLENPYRGKPYVNEGPKIGRNSPCSCGSNKKFKNCCINE